MDPVQGTLDELGTPLSDVTFVVFDLETTGGSPADHMITEIGAVKVRAGEVLGEFSTLVDPGGPIPPFISVLTGITDAMVVAAPRIESVLPAFLEFIRGTTLVAHNASFDTRFVKAACAAHGYPPPANPVVDTVDLARRVLTRDETPNAKLATLARFFRSPTDPCHRALQDARATVHVLHGLIERAGSFQVHTLEELKSFVRAPTPEQQAKRHLAESVPHSPGVYLFEDERGEVLYIGKSTNLRNRVRSYFTAGETRPRIREMIGIAERVRHIVCTTALEAEVRELRLIGGAKPRYNRRSRFPEKVVWLKLTDEPFPRLSIVRELKDDGAAYLGPFSSRPLGRRRPHRPARGGAAAPVHPADQPAHPPRGLRPVRDGPLRSAVRGQGEPGRLRAARPGRPPGHDPRRLVGLLRGVGPHGAPLGRAALRGGVRRP